MYRALAGLALVMLLFVIWVSHQATLGQQNIFMTIVRATPYGDKVGHFALFAILTALTIGATRFKGFKLAGYKIYWAALAVSLFAATDEILQHYSPNRTLDVYDLLFGVLGVIIVNLICNRVESI